MLLAQHEVMPLFERLGVVMANDHFVYTWGQHGSMYFYKDELCCHPVETSSLCEIIARHFKDHDVHTVIAPAIGAVVLSHEAALHLTLQKGYDVAGVYAQKIPDCSFTITRGFDRVVRHRNVLVIEDVLTTGGSARKVVEAVRALGGNVLAVAALCNRGGVTPHNLGDVPELFALTNVQMDAWDATVCPLCARGVPINTEVGHGREYLARLKQV